MTGRERAAGGADEMSSDMVDSDKVEDSKSRKGLNTVALKSSEWVAVACSEAFEPLPMPSPEFIII